MIGNTTIEIVKRVSTGEYGPLGTEQITEHTIVVTGCSLHTETTTETHGNTNTATITGRCYLPITDDTTAIDSRDAIRHNGRTYECQGPALTARDLHDAQHHVRVELKWTAS